MAWCILLTLLVVSPLGCGAPSGAVVSHDIAVREVVASVLSARSAALQDGDLERWRATVSHPDTSAGMREVEAFTSLRALGVTSVQLAGVVSVDPEGWPASARAVIDLGYAVPGVDRDLRIARRTVAIAGGATPTMEWLSPVDALEVFDLGRLNISRRGDVVLAVGSTLPPSATASATTEGWVDRVDVARSRVTDVFDVAPGVLVVVPVEVGEFARLVKRSTPAGSEGVAAVTEGARPRGVAAPADRVIVNPAAMASLSEQGQTVVLAHELTHVALRSVPPREVPLWWTEGCAEWTAYGGVTVPESRRWKAAVDRHRADPRWPYRLPVERDFDSGSTEFGAAYVVSEIAVSVLARSQGAGICARLAAAGSQSEGVTPAGETLQVLGVSEESVMAEVRAVLARTAAQT